MTTNPKPELSLAEVAVSVDRSECTVRRWIESGRLPAIRKLGRITVRRIEVEKLLAATPATLHLAGVPMA